MARNEVGLLITGHLYCHPRGQYAPLQMGVYDDAKIAGLAELASAVQAPRRPDLRAGRPRRQPVPGARGRAACALPRPQRADWPDGRRGHRGGDRGDDRVLCGRAPGESTRPASTVSTSTPPTATSSASSRRRWQIAAATAGEATQRRATSTHSPWRRPVRARRTRRLPGDDEDRLRRRPRQWPHRGRVGATAPRGSSASAWTGSRSRSASCRHRPTRQTPTSPLTASAPRRTGSSTGSSPHREPEAYFRPWAKALKRSVDDSGPPSRRHAHDRDHERDRQLG